MKLAFCLYKYFPFGGMQRNFLKIAKECADRGHKVVVYTMDWQGEQPDFLEIVQVQLSAINSTRKYKKFSAWLGRNLNNESIDLMVGFNKMPGLDVYYCGDPCYEYKSRNLRPWWYRYTPRYKHFSKFEKAVFKPGSMVDILMFSPIQKKLFQRFYDTESSRINMLPPGIARDRCVPANFADIRECFRKEFELDAGDILLLQIGSGFRTKGLDRSLRAISALPLELRSRTQLYVIGQDDPKEFISLAKSLGISNMVTFFSGRDDVPRFLQGADVLLHPSYAENTGGVILEAIVAGLPSLVTDVCGYAHYVKKAKAGILLESPYSQTVYNSRLEEMLLADKLKWRENGINFSKEADIYDMPVKAADVVDRVIERKWAAKNRMDRVE
jgi:UDP-glucose:(heptosyl)LPS alpha-1,3-glucosyltransferase|tara:strand:- start:588 stop:1742 length:1155 start_codon:yes stop_codon:yes gene_type:complete